MTHKEIVREINRGFELDDHDMIMKHIHDDVVWFCPGAFTARGAAEFRKHIRDDVSFSGTPTITVKNEIAEGEWLAVEGEVKVKLKSGQPIELYFHDTYRFKDNKVISMTSYLVPKNS